MPIFSALWCRAVFGERLSARQLAGVAAAAAAAAMLLWHELAHMAGRPWAVAGMLTAAAVWALGTQQLRRARMATPLPAVIFWMTLITALVMTTLAVSVERAAWIGPSAAVWAAIAFNALLIFGFAQPAWLYLVRSLPPVASTISVMLIPALGTASGAWWLNEQLHWQDAAALLMILAAIAAILWRAGTTALDQRA